MRLSYVLSLLSLIACSQTYTYDVPLASDSPWPKFRRNAVQDGHGVGEARHGSGEPWVFQTSKGIFSSPVIGGDGTIYIGSADRTFYALTPEGEERWSFQTDEIIDSSALLDDSGSLYFGSGDGHVYALDAETGELSWQFQADDPSENNAFIRWFEGNVAMLPSGDLVIPNDNFYVYSLDRFTGDVNWRFQMRDQTWSLPAVDPSTGHLYIGNNNLLPVDGNTYAIDGNTGEQLWLQDASLGSVAASPMFHDGRVFAGGFDGILRSYDADDGDEQWTFEAKDHLYSSPSLLSDGTLVQASADGTVYGIDVDTGDQRWAFDTGEPIRSSPAVGGDDIVYFGGGNGRLYAINPDGTLRWSIQLIEGDRNDLNSSPALGEGGLVIAGESGGIFYVPFDWCLENEDDRCYTGGEELPENGVHLLQTTRFGSLRTELASTVGVTEALALSLVVREDGDTKLSLIDTESVEVTVTPQTDIEVVVSADRRFLTLLPPATGWIGESVQIEISGQTLVDPDRTGLRFEGGTPDDTFDATLDFTVDRSGPTTLPGAEPGATWELLRLAAPMPTILPSYNQIGFDSLHHQLGLVEFDGSHGVGWVMGSLPEGQVDPNTGTLFPVVVTWQDGGLHLQSDGGMSLEAMNITIAFDDFRIAAQLDDTGAAPEGAVVTVNTICADIPLYGTFMRQLGFCNPDSDSLHVFGGALLEPLGTPTAFDPGTVEMSLENDTLSATFTPDFEPTEHRLALLVLDDTTGLPVALDYGTETTVEVDGSEVTVSLPTGTLQDDVRVWLMVDTFPAASQVLTVE